MGGACGTYGQVRKVHVGLWWRNLRERAHVEALDKNKTIISNNNNNIIIIIIIIIKQIILIKTINLKKGAGEGVKWINAHSGSKKRREVFDSSLIRKASAPCK